MTMISRPGKPIVCPFPISNPPVKNDPNRLATDIPRELVDQTSVDNSLPPEASQPPEDPISIIDDPIPPDPLKTRLLQDHSKALLQRDVTLHQSYESFFGSPESSMSSDPVAQLDDLFKATPGTVRTGTGVGDG